MKSMYDIIYTMSDKLDTKSESWGWLNSSFEEKSAWIQLFGLVLVLAGYGWVAGQMMAAGVNHILPYVPVFAVAVVLLVTLLVAGHVIAIISRRPDEGDERDRLIGWKAESRSGWILGFGVLLALGCQACGVGTVVVAHVLLLSMFLSEIVKLALQLIYYGRGV